MKITDRSVLRLAVVQHLRAAYGIKVKNWNKSKVNNKMSSNHSGKVFGVPLDGLPQCTVAEYGTIPCFLVDTCARLMENIHTEGLFRKSGSVVRLKALRAKLEQGEECISTALPCDVAGLLKQFFRELPDPILPTELQEALLKAQQLATAEERTSALQLVSCVLPDRNSHTLRYFFSFLKDVSQRCGENKMDSGNLSVILAPSLLQNEGTEKMNSSTERRLKLQAAVVHFFIENPQDFGVVPSFILERIPAMVGCDASLASPHTEAVYNRETDSGVKKRQRRSLGDMVTGALHKLKSNRTPTNTPQLDGHVFSSATPVIMTPNTKRKLPQDLGCSQGFSNKKRRSIKKNLGMELLPNSLFSSSSTPGSGQGLDFSPSVSLDSTQSPSVGKHRRPCATSARRKSRRRSSKHVCRVESGKAGCFSPKVSKKETVRRSLRLRFSLGRSREPNVIPQSLMGVKGSEAIGWRLATQESTSTFFFSKDPAFSPEFLGNESASKHSKHMSKSEDNLLTPHCDSAGQHASWNMGSPVRAQAFRDDSFSDTPLGTCCKDKYSSEPTLLSGKPSVTLSVPKSLCCASSTESLDVGGQDILTGPTLFQIRRAFAESGSDLRTLIGDQSAVPGKQMGEGPEQTNTQGSQQNGVSPAPQNSVADDRNTTLSELEMTPLTPLHIDSALFELGMLATPLAKEELAVQCADSATDEINRAIHSTLCEVIDSSSPTVPYSTRLQVTESSGPLTVRLGTPLAVQVVDTVKSAQSETPREHLEKATGATEVHYLRVADHIQKFNTLTLSSPKTKPLRSPLKFQRTPVRQSVRRINSLQGNTRLKQAPPSPVVKCVSLESGLCVATLPPKAAPRKPTIIRQVTIGCASPLDDKTNKVRQKSRGEMKNDTACHPARSDKMLVQQVCEKDRRLYRGSPKNPLSQGKLLSAMRPIDL